MNIYLDIETIPDQRENALADYTAAEQADFRAPSSLTKEQAIADLSAVGEDPEQLKYLSKPAVLDKWCVQMAAAKAAEQAEEKWRKTALNGGYGQIYCIGLAIDADDSPVKIICAEEPAMLAAFSGCLQSIIRQHHSHPAAVRFVGHNIEWDLRFLHHRCVIHGIKPSAPLIHSRYSEQIYDTMQAWAGYGNRISLAELCRILGIDNPKNGIDGSQVWDFVRDGRGEEVQEYCRRDVEAVRQVFKRLEFQAA